MQTKKDEPLTLAQAMAYEAQAPVAVMVQALESAPMKSIRAFVVECMNKPFGKTMGKYILSPIALAWVTDNEPKRDKYGAYPADRVFGEQLELPAELLFKEKDATANYVVAERSERETS